MCKYCTFLKAAYRHIFLLCLLRLNDLFVIVVRPGSTVQCFYKIPGNAKG